MHRRPRLASIWLLLGLVTASPAPAPDAPAAGLPAPPAACRAEPPASTPVPWPEEASLAFVARQPLPFQAHHVQGLAVSDSRYYVTAVDVWHRRAWLFAVDRTTRRLIARRELTEQRLIHPGGLSLDPCVLWIPVAAYNRHGPTQVVALNPSTLEVVYGFPVADHVSLVASDGRDRLYGTDWDSRHFLTWDRSGRLLARVPSPTGVEYQDCTFVQPHLVCGGHRGIAGMIDVIDPRSWRLVQRIPVGRTPSSRLLTREGLAVYDGHVYLLPEDGRSAAVHVFQLPPAEDARRATQPW